MSNLKKKKAAIQNLGCKVNAYEATAIEEALINDGYEIVDFEHKAQVYVINTCTVTAVADKKSRQMIRRAKSHNKDAIVVACGCYVQKDAESLRDDCDIILGNDAKNEIVEKLHELAINKQSEPLMDLVSLEGEYVDTPISSSKDKTRAFLKIQDGCNHFCSYCIIPYVRGRSRSRSIESIVNEAHVLAAAGYKEIVFCGINLSDFSFNGKGLIDLVKEINAVDGIERIRLGSLEPDVFTDEFVVAIKGCKKVCPHFHFSLQSACDTTLKKMNRKYCFSEVRNAVSRLREAYGKPAICADVIAGFPTESEEDFETCFKNIDSLDFYQLHVFPYSRREGTRAYDLPQLDKKTKNKRAARLIELSKEKEEKFKNLHKGSLKKVLFEEKKEIDGKTCWVGYSPEYIKCSKESNENLHGKILEVVLDVK